MQQTLCEIQTFNRCLDFDLVYESGFLLDGDHKLHACALCVPERALSF